MAAVHPKIISTKFDQDLLVFFMYNCPRSMPSIDVIYLIEHLLSINKPGFIMSSHFMMQRSSNFSDDSSFINDFIRCASH